MPGPDLHRMSDVLLGVVKTAVHAALAPIAERVLALEARPVAKDGLAGRDGVDGQDGMPGAPGRDGIDGKDGRPGKDGAPGRNGVDGLPGKDGAAGRDGIDGRDGLAGLAGRDGKDGAPGVHGKDGAPGRDGVGFDDLSVLHDGGRTVTLRFTRADVVKEFPLTFAVPLYQGVYKDTIAYHQGDAVTFGGSVWIARAETQDKPGEGATAWQLAVKAGRDGKPGKDGEKGEKGLPGKDGSKW